MDRCTASNPGGALALGHGIRCFFGGFDSYPEIIQKFKVAGVLSKNLDERTEAVFFLVRQIRFKIYMLLHHGLSHQQKQIYPFFTGVDELGFYHTQMDLLQVLWFLLVSQVCRHFSPENNV